MKLPDLKKLRIIHYPDPILHQVCEPAEPGDPAVAALAGRMLELMRDNNGVGLAGPQVGVPIRLFVCNHTGEPGNERICINPRLVGLDGADVKEEGCLSLPGVAVSMRRATHATLEAFDPAGTPYRCEAEGLEARIWQHETDHLNGRLIVDNMSTSDEIANRRALKQLEAERTGTRRL